MKKILQITILAFSIFLAHCHNRHKATKKYRESIKRQKTIINQNCASLENLKSVINENENLPLSELDYTKYFKSNYSKALPKTSIVFYVVFQPNIAPCCQRTVLSDSLSIDQKDLDDVTKVITNYPLLNEIKFNKDQKVRFLRVFLRGDEKGLVTVRPQ